MFERSGIVLAGLLLAVPGTGASDESLRDPTRPEHAGVPAAPTERAPATRYVVSAIFYSADRRVAVVNGRAVSAGDRVGTARVRAIGRDSLTLDVGGRTITAQLARTTVRR